MTRAADLAAELLATWSDERLDVVRVGDVLLKLRTGDRRAIEIVHWLVLHRRFQFGGMAVREEGERWQVHYLLYDRDPGGPWVEVGYDAPSTQAELPSLSSLVHAADWYEREAEDHFGVRFEGHPRLGDFVLHDEEWPEGLAPMRRAFDASAGAARGEPNCDWRPRRILHEPGAFAMTIGPIYGGIAEPVHFLLETTGENVVRAFPRLFYKYRAVEKRAEGQEIAAALLLAERFNAAEAFAHSFAFCRAIETVGGMVAPPRAHGLRVILAELERLRCHVGTIRAICGSTGLAVAEARASYLEEELLRTCGALAGHRYLFGLNLPGGLATDLSDVSCRSLVGRLSEAERALHTLDRMLATTSSFLDRLEEVGVITEKQASEHGLVGPVARASGVVCDLRRAHPYAGYEHYTFEVAREEEGDGYARLRVLFFEAFQAIAIIRQAVDRLPPGAVLASGGGAPGGGSAFGAVEASGGAALHWVWLDEEGRVARYRIAPPSFVNWHGFHLAAEDFAFQDFPIILATFALSVAENDR